MGQVFRELFHAPRISCNPPAERPRAREQPPASLRSIFEGWLWADLWIHGEDLAHAKPPELGTLVRPGPAAARMCPTLDEARSQRRGLQGDPDPLRGCRAGAPTAPPSMDAAVGWLLRAGVPQLLAVRGAHPVQLHPRAPLPTEPWPRGPQRAGASPLRPQLPGGRRLAPSGLTLRAFPFRLLSASLLLRWGWRGACSGSVFGLLAQARGLRAPARCLTVPRGTAEASNQGASLELSVVRKNRADHGVSQSPEGTFLKRLIKA